MHRRLPLSRSGGQTAAGGLLTLAFAVTVAAVAAGCSSPAGQEVRADDPQSAPAVTAVASTTTSLWAFAADLTRAIAARDPNANVVVAPVPVALNLAQARAGAGGATATQLGDALHADARFDVGLAAVASALTDRSGEREDRSTGRRGRVSVELASTLWGQRATTFGAPWLTTLATTWGTGIRVTDFRSDPETARATVNAWADEATNGHITQLLSRGALDELTGFLATSAGYLKAPWRTAFATSDTRVGSFVRLDGSSVAVTTMRRVDDTTGRHGTGDGWQAVELPYLGDELRLTVVVPDPGRFSEVERALDGPALARLPASLRPARLDVTLPRFGVTTDVDLDDALRALGVVDAFDRALADFSGITADEPLALAGVVQQTFFGLDEQGTEATASPGRPLPFAASPTSSPALPATTTTTAVTVDPSTPAPAPPTGPPTTRPPPTVVEVDRPFLVLVTDRATGAPLFYGRVLSPRA